MESVSDLLLFNCLKKSMWTLAAVVSRISGRDLPMLASRTSVLFLDNRIIDAGEIDSVLWRPM